MVEKTVGLVTFGVERDVKIRISVGGEEVLVLDPTEAYVLGLLLEEAGEVTDVDWSKVA